MSCGSMKVACEDGFEIVSKNEHELVKHVQLHLKDTHQKQATHADVMAMAKHP